MDIKVGKTITYGLLGMLAFEVLRVDDRKQLDIPAPSSYCFDNSHILSEVVSSGAVAGSTTSTTVDGISGDWFIR